VESGTCWTHCADPEGKTLEFKRDLSSPEGLLRRVQLLTDYHGRTVPTAGGILLFGENRLQSFPDAWIQAGRFDGTNRATIADHAEFNGSLLAGIEQAVAFIEKRALTDADFSAVRG